MSWYSGCEDPQYVRRRPSGRRNRYDGVIALKNVRNDLGLYAYVRTMEAEPRKVQRLGYSSMGVSLPKDWAKGCGIEPGSTVLIVKEDDGTLRIRAGGGRDLPAQD